MSLTNTESIYGCGIYYQEIVPKTGDLYVVGLASRDKERDDTNVVVFQVYVSPRGDFNTVPKEVEFATFECGVGNEFTLKVDPLKPDLWSFFSNVPERPRLKGVHFGILEYT